MVRRASVRSALVGLVVTALSVAALAGADGPAAAAPSVQPGSDADATAAAPAVVSVVTGTPTRVVSDLSVRPGDIRCASVVGAAAGVSEDATGVLVTVTTVRPTGPGYVVVYPDVAGTGFTMPPAGSTVNFEPGQDVANGAFVAVPASGRICYLTRGAAKAGVLIDVTGYTLPGSGIVTRTPRRLLDTRTPGGQIVGRLAPRQVHRVDVAGQVGVPEDAAAVLLNVTATGVSGVGNLRVFAGGRAVRPTSVLNYAPGRDKANASVVELGDDGSVSLWSDTGSPVHVVLDVAGWVAEGAAYEPTAPTRVVDTRRGLGLPQALRAGSYPVALRGVDPVPDDATAVVLNVTAVGPTGVGNLRVGPWADGSVPSTSVVNFIAGRDIPNQVVVGLGADGRVMLHADMLRGRVHAVVDVVGYVHAAAPVPEPDPEPYVPTGPMADLGFRPFPATDPWNTRVDAAPVDARSTTLIASIGASDHLHMDFGANWNGGPFGIPYVVVGPDQPRVNVTFGYADESDPGPYPIPPDAPIEGGAASDGDRHVLVVDAGTRTLYELYAAYPQPDGSWHAGSGAVFDLVNGTTRPAGWTSADAAGLPILPGLVRYEEVAAGRIDHALRFTVSQTRRAYVAPARHFASNNTSADLPPMGMRVRLRADYDVSGYSQQARVILQAMKEYGMIVADNGSDWFVSGTPDARWDDDQLNELKDVPGSAFEVVQMGPITTG